MVTAWLASRSAARPATGAGAGGCRAPVARPDRPRRGAGAIDNERANLYRVYALKGDPRLPAAYESDTPFDGTLWSCARPGASCAAWSPGAERSGGRGAAAPPPDPNPTFCDVLSPTPLPDSAETAHFYIQYNARGTIGGGLDINDYTESLETVVGDGGRRLRVGGAAAHRARADPDPAASTTCGSTPWRRSSTAS